MKSCSGWWSSTEHSGSRTFLLGRSSALHGPLDQAVSLAEQAYALAPWFKPNVGFLAAMLKRTGANSTG